MCVPRGSQRNKELVVNSMTWGGGGAQKVLGVRCHPGRGLSVCSSSSVYPHRPLMGPAWAALIFHDLQANCYGLILVSEELLCILIV